MQTLRKPSTREAYDQQLAFAAAQQQVLVSQTIMLADMEPVQSSVEDSPDAPGNIAYHFACRCGGAYWLDGIAFHIPQSRVVLQCDTCSLNIEVYLDTL